MFDFFQDPATNILIKSLQKPTKAFQTYPSKDAKTWLANRGNLNISSSFPATLTYLQHSPTSVKLSSTNFLKITCVSKHLHTRGVSVVKWLNCTLETLGDQKLAVSPAKRPPCSATFLTPTTCFLLLRMFWGIPRKGPISNTNFWAAETHPRLRNQRLRNYLNLPFCYK